MRTAISILTLLLLSGPLRGQTCRHVVIRTDDGVDLEATITYPAGAPGPGGFPGIVLVHGFGGDMDEMKPAALTLSGLGYASLAYSVRGQGHSGGLSTACGDRERKDLLQVIQFFRSCPGIIPDDLGVTGGSQGGVHAWMAAVDRMPGVRAVAPLLATPDYVSALVPNGCVSSGLPRELTQPSVRYGADRDIARELIIREEYDSLLFYINARDLEPYTVNVRIPVLQGLAWADFLFPANGGIRAAEALSARNVPVWSYFGTNGHGESPDPAEATFLRDQVVRWFDHWLKNVPLPSDSVPTTFYSDDRPGWPHHVCKGWLLRPSRICTLYVTSHGLSLVPPSGPHSFPFQQFWDSTFTPAMAWESSYGGPGFVHAFSAAPQQFTSLPLRVDAELTGTPSGRFLVRGDVPRFQMHIRLFDVEPRDGGYVWHLISRSTNGIRNSRADELHDLSITGSAVSHVVPAGHRIGIEVTSLDMATELQAHIIPYFVTSRASIVSSALSPSYVAIPLIGPEPFSTAVAHNVPVPGGPLSARHGAGVDMPVPLHQSAR